jgi:CheY-like chemotaxis protein
MVSLPLVPPLVLLVEDQPAISDILTTLLMEAGYRSILTDNGETAIGLLDLVCIDLVILDLDLPGVNRYTVLEHICANIHTRNVPVVALSALPDELARAKANHVIEHSFEPHELLDTVQRLVPTPYPLEARVVGG